MSNVSPEDLIELQKQNCIFCKIIGKEIPSNEIYTNENISVILDINPAHEGHSLVLPKKHFQILPQIPDKLIGVLFVAAKNTSRVLLKALAVKGTTIFVANGALAGQKAPHFMIHVVPRKRGDLLFKIPKNSIDEKQLKEIHQNLKNKMGSSAGRPQITLKPDVSENDNKSEKLPDKSDQEKVEEKSIDIDKISKMFT